MKLKFKNQAYQTIAVEAVADCFAGQTNNAGIKYRIDPGRVEEQGQATLDMTSGFKNSDLVITHKQLFENIHTVQRR